MLSGRIDSPPRAASPRTQAVEKEPPLTIETSIIVLLLMTLLQILYLLPVRRKEPKLIVLLPPHKYHPELDHLSHHNKVRPKIISL